MEGAVSLSRDSATRMVASTLGVLVGLAGIEHGILEMLQGNVRPNGLIIEAIGADQKIWEYASEPAFSLIPNMLASGILSTIFGLLLVVWSIGYIDRKYGAWILLLLSIILWLVGGGFAPIIFSVFAFAVATRIGKPLSWWRKILPESVRGFLARLWPWSDIAFVLVFLFGVEIAIFGYPLLYFLDADTTYNVQFTSAYLMLALMLLAIVTAFAYDIEAQEQLSH